MLAPFGWAAVHALWLSTLIAALTALGLTLLADSRARVKHVLAYVALVAMVLAPIVIVLASIDLFTPSARQQVTNVVDATVGFTSFVSWRGPTVRAAAIIWLIGVAAVALRLAAEWRRLAGLRPAGVERVDAGLSEDVRALSATFGIAQSVVVFQSRVAHVPMVFGLRQPTILLPVTMTSTLSGPQIRVKCHEEFRASG
jgi:beta-lactamase regulating signal transducer with metallopeptidase domain